MFEGIAMSLSSFSLEARSLGAGLTSFALVLLGGRGFIAWMRKKQFGQVIRDLGPKTHYSKKDTPTMGGILLIFSILLGAGLWGNWANVPLLVSFFVLITMGGVGFLDDYLKIMRRNSGGLKSRYKFLSLGLIALLAGLFLHAINPKGELLIPYSQMCLSWGPWMILIYFLALNGSANAVNLTDGQDGLVSFPVALCALVFLIFVFSHPMGLGIHALSEMAVLSAAVMGACIGFLWFNAYPAELFMGDVGALPLGGVLAVIAISLRLELLYILLGGVFVLEALSVILQVGYFKWTRGKRIFRMAPLHHHFELGGIPEPKVTMRFWILAGVFAVLALIDNFPTHF